MVDVPSLSLVVARILSQEIPCRRALATACAALWAAPLGVAGEAQGGEKQVMWTPVGFFDQTRAAE